MKQVPDESESIEVVISLTADDTFDVYNSCFDVPRDEIVTDPHVAMRHIVKCPFCTLIAVEIEEIRDAAIDRAIFPMSH